MRPHWLRLGLVGLMAFVAGLISQFPAAPVLTQLRDISGLELRWQRVTGDLFDMTIHALELTSPGGRRPVIDSLHLQLSPLAIVRGRLSFAIKARAWTGSASADLSLGTRHWLLDELQGQVPLAGLYPVLPELQISGVEGEMRIRGEDLQGPYNGWPGSGDVEIGLTGLVVALLVPDRSLGDYDVHLTVAGDRLVNGRINSPGSESLLQLDANLTLDGNTRSLGITGRGELAASAPDSLRDALPLLGEVQGRRVEINWRQPLMSTTR